MSATSETTTDTQIEQQDLSKFKKGELIEVVKQHRTNEELLRLEIQELRKEILQIKETVKEIKEFNPQRGIEKRLISIERRIAEQEQYSRRECIEIVGLPQNINGEDLENRVVETFDTAGVKVRRRDFHAIHRLKDRKTVIAKLVNRRDAIGILKNKKKLRNLTSNDKKRLNSEKIYINESLCRPYRQLLGKCNALYKRRHINSFYTINGKLKIHYDSEDEHGEREEVTVITHEIDLYDIFGEEIMKEIQQI